MEDNLEENDGQKTFYRKEVRDAAARGTPDREAPTRGLVITHYLCVCWEGEGPGGTVRRENSDISFLLQH